MDGSNFEHERITSREKATRVAEDHGWTFQNALASITRVRARELPPTRAEADAAEKAKRVAAAAEDAKVREWELSLEPLIKLYGSREAAFAPCRREQALLASVVRWHVAMPSPNGRWTKTLDGSSTHVVRSALVLEALKNAYPLPTTILLAKFEHDYWIARGRELAMLRRMDEQAPVRALDIVAIARLRLVDQLLRHGIRADSAQELDIRCGIVLSNHPTRKELDAVREDAALLARRESDRARFGERRDVSLAVRIALANERYAKFGDRAIARIVGCSPTTVSKVRRKAEVDTSTKPTF